MATVADFDPSAPSIVAPLAAEVTRLTPRGTWWPGTSRRWRPDWEQAVHLPPRDGQAIVGVARVG